MSIRNEVIHINGLNTVCQRCRIKNICIINKVSFNRRKKFSELVIHDKPLSHGEHLYWSGAPYDFVSIVHSGSFKTYVENESGESQITGFHFQGDLLGFDGMVGNSQHNSAIALETSSVCKIPVVELDKMISQQPTLSQEFLNILCRDYIYKQKMLFVLGKMTAEQRVADFIVHMSEECEKRNYSSLEFNLSMARIEIANYLGVAVETVSRVFRGLQDKGFIRVERRKISIQNFSALKSLLTYTHETKALKSADRQGNLN